MDIEVVADLFHAAFEVMRQVDEDFTSLYVVPMEPMILATELNNLQ